MKDKGVNVYNLGTGNGYSVLEIVKTFEDVNGVKVNKKIVARREGDIAECYADSSKAYKELGWKAELDLSDMVSSAYNYAINNKK
jgi:UDP-glucose 4-epimerase